MKQRGAKKDPLYIIKYILFAAFFSALILFFICIASHFEKSFSDSKSADAFSPDSVPTIVIDAGHGGEDGGTSSGGVVEKDLNLSISRDLADMLRAAGYEVLLTRNEDRLLYDPQSDYVGRKKQLDLAERVRIGESVENCIFISIHMNAFPDPKYRGLQVYFSANDESSKALAQSIQSSVCQHLQTDNKRTIKKATSRIFILNQIKKPAVLVECAFLSNPEECALIATPEYRKKLTFCIFSGICEFISENKC